MPKLKTKRNKISFCSVCNITTTRWKNHFMGGGDEFERHRKKVIYHSENNFLSDNTSLKEGQKYIKIL